TLADLFEGDSEEEQRRAEDIYLLMLNPYFLARTIIFFLVDVVRELWQGWQQQRKDVQPRLDRLAHGYPFVRAAMTVLMRDVAANLTILDIIRGAPSIYVTWPGYDEVAHHSGPWTSDAFKVLATYDQVIARIGRTIREKAPRPYDLIILSDHGQSCGATFKQRYGLSLKEFIEQQLPQGATVAQSMGGDTGVNSLTAASRELEKIQQTGVGGAGGRALARRGQKLLDHGARQQEEMVGDSSYAQPAQVTAYGSGNLAQVYFDLHQRKIKLYELNAAYPGMVDALVQHEGIGLVCGYADDGAPVALGKRGTRNLHTGEVMGDDPLQPYAADAPNAYGHASLETRAWQVRRIMDFPHAGDLMVISTVYPDGSVAALEELIGNHGGLGGEQTDAFLFHPADLTVPPTRNAIDVFPILNDRRRQPVAENKGHKLPVLDPAVNAWALSNLWAGLKDIRTWASLAGRTLFLDRSAYQEVVDDKRMIGPALLLGLGLLALFTWARYAQSFGMLLSFLLIPVSIAAWLVAVLGIHVAGRVIADKGSYTRTLRGLGFANVFMLVEMIGLIPALAPVAAPIGAWLSIIAIWMGAAAAHNAKGWRSIILPILGILFAVLLPLLVPAMVGGAIFSLESLWALLGSLIW
ncbi:MAG: YIP1 family protein, partial [Caldilinea sp.]